MPEQAHSDAHDHTWLQEYVFGVPTVSMRCTCGEYLHSQSVAVKIAVGRQLHAERVARGDCADPNCQLKAGHASLHMCRTWDIREGCAVVAEWQDFAVTSDNNNGGAE